MLDRIWKVHSRSDRHGAGSRPGSKHSGCQPLVEVLEGRQLLTASLAPIANVTVPALLGYQLALDGSGTTDDQTFTATSSNPDIKVSVAQGPFWTITGISPGSSTPGDVTFNNEPMTFQLFNDLTPNTVDRITTCTNTTRLLLRFNSATGKFIPRITSVASSGSHPPGRLDQRDQSLLQSSGVPPIATEIVQQLAFTGAEPTRHGKYRFPEHQQRRAVLHHQRHSLAVHSAALISTTRSSASSSRASKP